MKIFLVSIIVLASSLVNAAAIASEVQVVHDDNEPETCDLFKEKEDIGTCNSFKVVKQDKLYMFVYDFKKYQIGFLANSPSEDKVKDTVTYAVKQLYYDGKVHNLKEAGFCVADKNYLFVSCVANGVEASYAVY